MMKKPKKKLSYKAKYNWLMFGSIMATITPLVAVMGYNYKIYFTSYNSTKLYIGSMLGLGTILIIVVGKLKLKRIMWLAIVFGIAVFFESLFNDIVLLTGALLGGGVIDELFFNRKVKKYERLYKKFEDAEVEAEVARETNKEFVKEIAEVIRGGRV